MRITRDTLLKIASDATARQAREHSDLLAACLYGSLLGDDFLLGGATDIDLIYIYAATPPLPREIVRMTDEVHLDLMHLGQREYRDTRRLRLNPWMGPVVTSCKVLYDPQHFMDFTQASVRGQYDRPEYIFERARSLLDEGRQLWMQYQLHSEVDAGPAEVDTYLRALECAANCLASLVDGPPLSERRFLPEFTRRMALLGKPGLVAGLLGLLGLPNLAPEGAGLLEDWLGDWQVAFRAANQRVLSGERARLQRDRLFYYSSAMQAQLMGGQAEAALWPLLRTWTLASHALDDDEQYRAPWTAAFHRLGLAGVAFTGRIEALDGYLDTIEELLENWAHDNGAIGK